MDTKTDERLFRHMVQNVTDYAIFALDPLGHVVSWNKGAERIKGYSENEILGKHFSVFHEQIDNKREHADSILAAALKNGSYKEDGFRLRKNGEKFWAHVVISAMFDEDHRHIGFSKVTRDLTERRSLLAINRISEAALEKSQASFQTMVNEVIDYAIFLLDKDGYISSWNQGAARINGYSASEILGQHFSIFYTEESRSRKHPQFELEQAAMSGRYTEEGWRIRKDGSNFWASVTITCIKTSEGEVSGFIKVTRDLTDVKRYEAEIRFARDEAIKANQLKSQFIANITHEIRTPLASIVGLSELIALENNLEADSKQSVDAIFESSKLLMGMVNEMLDFARLESGRVVLEIIEFNPHELMSNVVALTRRSIEEKGLELFVKIDENVPTKMSSDPAKLRQVVLNLLSNASKFTPSGAVELLVSRSAGGIRFEVKDTGIGISAENQGKLFKPFSQAHESTSRLYGGTGLGLSIAQEYVGLLGGKITIQSDVGMGSTFSFELPIELSREN